MKKTRFTEAQIISASSSWRKQARRQGRSVEVSGLVKGRSTAGKASMAGRMPANYGRVGGTPRDG